MERGAQRGKKGRPNPGRPKRDDPFQIIEPGLALGAEILAIPTAIERVGRAIHPPTEGDSTRTIAENFFAERIAQLATVGELRRRFSRFELFEMRKTLVQNLVRQVNGIIDGLGDAARVHLVKRKVRRRLPIVVATVGETTLDGKTKVTQRLARTLVAGMHGYAANESITRSLMKRTGSTRALGLEDIEPRVLKKTRR